MSVRARCDGGSGPAVATVEHPHDRLCLSVSDDGPGMILGAEWGVGLGGMRERAEELGGSFELRSDHRGTSIIACLPSAMNVVAHARPPVMQPVGEMRVR